MDESRSAASQFQVSDSAAFSAKPRVPPSRELSRDELRALVRDWTVALRTEGMRPEQALVRVKAHVRDNVLPSASYLVAGDEEARQNVALSDASTFCIEAYFDEGVTVGDGASDQADGAHRTTGQSR